MSREREVRPDNPRRLFRRQRKAPQLTSSNADASHGDDQRSAFCIRFLCEMTRVCRIIRSDDTLSEIEKAEALRWVDAIQHRVIDACEHHNGSLLELHRALMAQSEHTRVLPMVVASAWQYAEQWVAEHDV